MLFIGNKIVFIKRVYGVPSHKGQIGFFGGHRESSEVSPTQTALRELEEESGIDASRIKIRGFAPKIKTSRLKTIIPVVSSFLGTEEDFKKMIKPNREWSNLIIVPVSYLLEIQNWSLAKIVSDPVYYVYFCSLIDKRNDFYKDQGNSNYMLWGASAKMIWSLFEKSILSAKN